MAEAYVNKTVLKAERVKTNRISNVLFLFFAVKGVEKFVLIGKNLAESPYKHIYKKAS